MDPLLSNEPEDILKETLGFNLCVLRCGSTSGCGRGIAPPPSITWERPDQPQLLVLRYVTYFMCKPN